MVRVSVPNQIPAAEIFLAKREPAAKWGQKNGTGTAPARGCRFPRPYVFSAKGAAHTSLGQRPRSDVSQ